MAREVETVEIEVKILAETPKAVLCIQEEDGEDDGKWLPRSQIELRQTPGAWGGWVVDMPTWLVEKIGWA